MVDLLCRTAYDSFFLDGLGRVQSTSLSKISVDETIDFIVRRGRRHECKNRADEDKQLGYPVKRVDY